MNSKRKGRGGGNTLGRSERGHSGGAANNNKQSKSPEKEVNHTPPPLDNKESSPGEFSGIWRNARFTWALTSLIGVPLRVETSTNDEFEGILKTFSPELEIVLEQSHKIDHANEDTVNHKSIIEKHVFPLKDVVRYYAKDVDMEYAMKESFLTDTQISQTRTNGEAGMRELEMWQPDEGDQSLGIEEGDLKASTGWSANDMFAKNEERFGVQSSYDPNLSGYTTQLAKDKFGSGSDMEKQAAKIASEIDGEGSRFRAELENGDEEDAFSAVVRSGGDRRNGGGNRERESPGDDKPSAYVPPNRRSEGRGFARGRGQRTPPPRNNYDNNYDDRDHNRQREDRRDRYGGGNNRRDYNNDRGHDRSGGDQRYHGDRGGYREDRSYGRQDSHGKKEDYRYDERRDHRDGRDNRGEGGGRGDGGGRGEKYRGGDRPGSSQDSRRDDRKSVEKVSPLPPHDMDRQKSGDRNRSPATNNGPDSLGMEGALPQREGGRRKQEKSKEMAKLQDFHQNFKLKISDDPQQQQQQGGPPPHQNIMSPNAPPTVSINASPAVGHSNDLADGARSSGPSPRVGMEQHNQRPSMSPRGGMVETGPPRGVDGSQMPDRNSPRNSIAGGHQMPPGMVGGHQGPPGMQQGGVPDGRGGVTTPRPSPAPMSNQNTGPPGTPSGGGGGTPQQNTPTSNSANKSTLNPNAKEFSFNPGAKEFTPKFMSGPRPSPTPPRVQTPVQTMGQVYPPMIHVQGGQPGMHPGHVVSMAMPPNQQQQRPMRPNSKDGLQPIRADIAAGQPIIQPPHGYYHPPGAGPGPAQQIQYLPPQGQPFIRMGPPQGNIAMNMISTNMMHIPISQHPGTPAQGGGPQQGQPQNPQVQHIWNQQMLSTPSPLHQHSGAPPPQQMGVPPQNTMTATPPNLVGHGGGAVPSPGPAPIMGYHQPPHQGPQMMLIHPHQLQQFHPQGHGQAQGGMPGGPVTSLPYQQLMGGQPAFHVVQQAPPHQQ